MRAFKAIVEATGALKRKCGDDLSATDAMFNTVRKLDGITEAVLSKHFPDSKVFDE